LIKPNRNETKAMSQGKPPPKTYNKDKREREYLTPVEVEALVQAAANTGRHGFRDALLIFMTYKHALRVSEVTALSWKDLTISRGKGKVKINRLKNGIPGEHPLSEDETQALSRLRKEYPQSEFVFCSERLGPLSVNAVHKIVARAGQEAGLKFSTHAHMLRHCRGYALVAQGLAEGQIQTYLGHKKLQNTSLYSSMEKRKLKQMNREIIFKTR